MQSPVPQAVSMRNMSVPGNSPAPSNDCLAGAQTGIADHQFIALLDSYRSSGGFAQAQEVSDRFRRHSGSDASTLARWINHREVISVVWQSKLWLPLFQFKRVDMSRQTGLDQVLAELRCIYDPWELAHWFSQPNAWLAEQSPADALCLDLPAVLLAARADRFAAVA